MYCVTHDVEMTVKGTLIVCLLSALLFELCQQHPSVIFSQFPGQTRTLITLSVALTPRWMIDISVFVEVQHLSCILQIIVVIKYIINKRSSKLCGYNALVK